MYDAIEVIDNSGQHFLNRYWIRCSIILKVLKKWCVWICAYMYWDQKRALGPLPDRDAGNQSAVFSQSLVQVLLSHEALILGAEVLHF